MTRYVTTNFLKNVKQKSAQVAPIFYFQLKPLLEATMSTSSEEWCEQSQRHQDCDDNRKDDICV